MKRQVIFTRKELNEYIDEQANIIIEKMFKNKNKISENRERFKTEKRLTNKIFESMMWKMGLKKSVRLNETIGEAGHLYGHYEDGTPFTNSKETYRGVPGSIYIWHGAWSDPEVIWKGVSLNANDIEDRLWYSYEDRCEENGEEPTEQGYDAWVENEDIASTLDELVWAAQGNPQ